MMSLASPAVMARRHEPPDSLDFFPTPPWATRALIEHVIGKDGLKQQIAWEPAAGEGHMAEVLREYFGGVRASDVHDYGRGYEIGSFVGAGPDVIADNGLAHWIITNPPFNLAEEFALRAIPLAKVGVALLLRTAWIEGGTRYRTIFRETPPSDVAIFCERVPMHRGRWDPDGSTATAYAWFVWRHPLGSRARCHWIPPRQRVHLEHPDDRKRFAIAATSDVAPLFEGVS